MCQWIGISEAGECDVVALSQIYRTTKKTPKMIHSSISSNFIEVNNRKIHYLSAGEGATILLLHGWPTSSYLWRNIMPALAKKNRVIAMDLPGFGQSEKALADSYSFRFYDRILDGFLAALKIEKVTLGLHDLGGPLGLFWAMQRLEKVDRLIFMNTLVYPDFSWMVKLFGLSTAVPILKNIMSSPKGIERALNFGVHQKEPLSKAIIQVYQAPFATAAAREVLLKTVQNLSPKGFHEISQQLSSFKGPVQILYGEKDRILPKVKDTMERVKKDLPQAQVRIFPNCGHFLQEEMPEAIAETLVDFMK